MPTEKELEQIYNALPQNTKDLLSSPNTAREVKHLGGKYDLNISDTEMLLNEVGLVLLGVENRETFTEDLMEVLGMREEQATSLAQEISISIFSQAAKPIPLPTEAEITIEAPSTDEKTENMRQILRKNSKTVNIKNIIANME